MKYKIAIFDMDGTILDTLDDLCDSVNYALTQHGLPVRTRQEIRSYLGNGFRNLLTNACPAETDPELFEEVFQTFKPYYRSHCAVKTCAYDGISEVIATLRRAGVITAVLSNKGDAAVQDLVKDYFPDMFDYAVGEREGVRRKPAPDGVFEVLRHFGCTAEEAVYIGDSEVDFATAKNAGTDVIMVGWGFRDEDYILAQGASRVIHQPGEILDLL